MSAKLYELATQYRQLEALESSEDLPAEVIRDTLEGLEGDIREKATNVAFFIENLRVTAAAIKDAATKMQERAKRLSARADSLHAYLQLNMQACGIAKVECPYFTLQLKKNPPTVVIDHLGSIPEKFWRQPEMPPMVLDKKAIAKAIASGEEVPGAHTETFERLEIKQ